MSRLMRDGTLPNPSRETKFSGANSADREIYSLSPHFPCSADHEQDWQPYPVDPCSCYMCDYTYNIRTYYIHTRVFNIIQKDKTPVFTSMFLTENNTTTTVCVVTNSRELLHKSRSWSAEQ